MKKVKLKIIIFLSSIFLLLPFTNKATAPPALLKIANSVASGNWNNPAIWSNGKVPADSTFVVIKSGHNVTLVANSTCESLVIEQNASLNNGTYKLTIQFMGWAHGIVHNGFDDGITYFGYAAIDNTWSITNPNNANWNIYKVDGIHSGTGDIAFSFSSLYSSFFNAYGMTISGSGTVSNTGSVYTENLNAGGQDIKFNSACHLTFYGDVKLIDNNNTLLYGGGNLSAENFGRIKFNGSANFIATNFNGVFTNRPNSSITLQSGSFYANPLPNTSSYLCGIDNFGLIHVQNGNFYMPDGAVVSNFDSIIINGSIIGASLMSVDNSFIIQAQQYCVLAVTGEIFPTTNNRGALLCTGIGSEPNYVIYNGSLPQNIFSPADISDPYNPLLIGPYSMLVINNTSGIGVTLPTNNININDTLVLNDGIVNTGIYEIFTTNNVSRSIINHSSNSYINGNLRRNVLSTGGSYDFPVGNPTSYQLANVNLTNAHTVSNLLANFSNIISAPGLPLTEGANIYSTILNCGGTALGIGNANDGVWSITPDAGFANYNLILYGKNYNNQGAVNTIVKRINSVSTWSLAGTYLPSTGSEPLIASRTNFSGFSQFAITSSSTLLPIELVSFSSNCENEKTNLNWTTASENNNSYFSVERSVDGITFKEIDKIIGAGNSSLQNNYSTLDYIISDEIVYYRLKQVDFNNKYSYSNIVSSNCLNSNKNNKINIYPNPFFEKTIIDLSNFDQHEGSIQLVSTIGELILEETLNNSNIYNNKYILNMSNYNSGTYFLIVKTASKSESRVLIKE